MNVRRHRQGARSSSISRSRGSRRTTALAVATVTALGAGALTSCSDDNGVADGKLDVVASFYPMQYLAEQIGGPHVEVSTLTEPGTEPHDLTLSARQTAHLQEADAVLYVKGIQPAVDESVDQSAAKTKIEAGALTTKEKLASEPAEHEEEGGHEGHGHDDHDHGGKDPHVWLDPVKYAEVAKGVGKALEKADPQHAADYRKNTDALVGRLDALSGRFEKGLADTRTKVFISSHSAFGYLAERYGLTQESISGLDPDSEPSAGRIKDLQHIAEEDGVTTVFYETLVSDKTAKTLADDAGLKTDVLDPVEGITDKSRGKDYIQVMDANLTALKKALGAK
ncbi:zinc ABC transporter substrate-binding protein [Streptomyces sp. NA04227]|uniref:metal ABC transporter substrate-binding protein n=1 Tax=Streptomyces sp. NA04227 TaxID=2742136 RepID=UPI0015928AD0|nr:metal ABC transporter substrate-binding protein [Streptomyces sp. NA04227]QKW06374.1 zinc ABC transporter substrate-binding protein [Streptomyces sp. NA04227]